MKRIFGLITFVVLIFGLMACKDNYENRVVAAARDFDYDLTSVTFTVEIVTGSQDITGIINLSLYNQDNLRVHNKDTNNIEDFRNYTISGLNNTHTYTLKVTATVGRRLETIVEQTFTLPTGQTIYINTVPEFMNMSSNRVGNYVLEQDLDFTGVTFASPFTQAFSGTFDGQGFTLKNITFQKIVAYTGVFGYITTGTVKNVNFDNVTIGTKESPIQMATSSMVGIVAGYINNQTGKIENVYVANSSIAYQTSSTVRAHVGSIVGDSRGDVQKAVTENTSIYVKSTSYGTINVGGAVGNLNEQAVLKEMMMDVDIHVEFAGNNLKDREIKVNVGGVIGYHNAINFNRSVEHLVSKGDILLDLDFGTAQNTTTANYSINVGGIAGIAMSNVNQAFVMGSIEVNHQANAHEADVKKYFNIGGLYGFYRSNKASLANLKLASATDTMTINVSNDVVVRASQLVAQSRSSAQNVFSYFGPLHLMINSVDQTGTDVIDVINTLDGFFDSSWITSYLPT